MDQANAERINTFLIKQYTNRRQVNRIGSFMKKAHGKLDLFQGITSIVAHIIKNVKRVLFGFWDSSLLFYKMLNNFIPRKILKINIDAEIGSGKIKIRTRTESDVESRLNSINII